MDHAGRLSRLRTGFEENDLDFLLVTHLPNIRYLCGFTGSAAALIVADRGSILFTDGRYRTQAEEEVKGAGVNHVKILIACKSPPLAAAEWLAAERRSSASLTPVSVGIEPESITAGMRDRLASVLKGRARLRSAPPLVERARMVKDAAEILRIRRAVELGASLFRIARRKIRPGVCEVEVAAAMEYEARCAGAEGMSFPTIVASGKRSAIVHGRASGRAFPAAGSWSAILVLYSPVIVRIAREPCTSDGRREKLSSFMRPCWKRSRRHRGGSSGRDSGRSGWRCASSAAQAEIGAVLHPFDWAWFRIRDTRGAQIGGGANPETGAGDGHYD